MLFLGQSWRNFQISRKWDLKLQQPGANPASLWIVIRTGTWRNYNVFMTSFCRHNDVIIVSCVRLDGAIIPTYDRNGHVPR